MKSAGRIAGLPDDDGRTTLPTRQVATSSHEEVHRTKNQGHGRTNLRFVLDLLHKMCYGTSRADLLRVGRSGDGGIDGVISLDRLGLEKVYVQAKRWQNSVGRPEVQAFYGALAGRRANKGVFITTASFSAQAIEFAASIERVVLVDGNKLAELMIEHEVGVASRPVRVPKIDSDYFEE